MLNRMSDLIPMYRIENILARHNSKELRGASLRFFNRCSNSAAAFSCQSPGLS